MKLLFLSLLMMMSTLGYSWNGQDLPDSITILNLPRSEWVKHIRQANIIFLHQERKISLFTEISASQHLQILDYKLALDIKESQIQDYKSIILLYEVSEGRYERTIQLQRRVIRTLIGIVVVTITYTVTQ